MSLDVTTRPLAPDDLPEVLELNAGVFGPGRFARTAFRVREGAPVQSAFCRVARVGGRLIAAVRFTEIDIGGQTGAVLLGPLVVAPDWAGRGYGRQLVREGLAEAERARRRLVILVGDLSYYGRLGFIPVPMDQIRLPGPVDPDRLLAAELVPGALSQYRGMVRAARQGQAAAAA
jgi:predicted N-acetyltransferase YhbS